MGPPKAIAKLVLVKWGPRQNLRKQRFGGESGGNAPFRGPQKQLPNWFWGKAEAMLRFMPLGGIRKQHLLKARISSSAGSAHPF